MRERANSQLMSFSSAFTRAGGVGKCAVTFGKVAKPESGMVAPPPGEGKKLE